MKTKCVIIDDEPLAIELIESHVAQLSHLEVVGTFKNAVSAFEFIKTNHVDLLFLDIQMPVLSGIDFLRSSNLSLKVIFTTAYREYALEGYELNVVDYLLKPITFERFFRAVDKYFELSSTKATAQLAEAVRIPDKDFLYVKENRKNVKISFDDILYIESLKDYIKAVTSEKTIIVKDKISDFENRLPEEHFLRVHRSFIVNTRKITAFTNNDIEINAIEIPIGGIYKQHVLKMLT